MKFITRLRLLEAKDPQGKDWEVVVIETGLGGNNRSYAANVLKDAVNLYEKCKVYLFERKQEADHLPEKEVQDKPWLVRNLVGWLTKPLFKSFQLNGKTHEGIVARLHIDDGSEDIRAKMLDAWKNGLNLFGLSHDADGDIVKVNRFGVDIESVEKIRDVSSVELVTYPAQGGQLLRLVASTGGYKMFEKLMEALLKIWKKIDAGLVEGIEESAVTDDQFLALVEAGIGNDKFFEEAKALEAKGPFMQSIVARIIKLLEGDKKEAAIKALTSLQDKLKSNGYPSPARASSDSGGAGNGDGGDDDVLTVDDLFPEGVDESKFTDCMRKEMKDGKTMAEAAKICKVSAKKAEPDDKNDDDEDKTKEALDRIKKVEESIKLAESAVVLNRTLTESKLFAPVLAKVRKQYEGRIFESKDLIETLTAEQDTLAKLTESGNLKGLGQTRIQVTLDESDKKQIAMDLMMGVDVKDAKGVGPFRGIREAYRSMNPDDQDITFTHQKPKRITEATMITGDFDNALGTSMRKKMLKLYKLLGMPYREFCNVVGITDFKQQERIRWGGFGEFPTVAEDGTYDNIAFPTDEKATYTPITKGGTFSIGRRAIKNDDMNMLRQIPTRLARAAAKTLNTFIWAFMINNNSNIYDGAYQFTTARGNLGSAALDFDSLGVAVTAMKGMREKGNYALEGTATGGASGTLIDSGAPFGGASAYVGYFVRIVYGTGVGQTREIASHDTTTLTLTSNWTVTVSTDSKYEVFQYADEKVGIKPAFLAVPTELEQTADLLLKNDWEPDTADRNINTLKGVAKKMVVGTLADANDWYLIADKAWLDIFELGFIDGKEQPTILIQDQANVGAMFTRDRITYKIRHEYGGAPVDYRGMYKAVVA